MVRSDPTSRQIAELYREARRSIRVRLSRYTDVASPRITPTTRPSHMLLLARSSPPLVEQPHRASGGERARMCLVHVLQHSIPSAYEPMASDGEWTRHSPNGPDSSSLATRCVASWTPHHTRPLATQHHRVQSLRRSK